MSAEPPEVNPFWVLEVATTATPVEIERQKQKLLGMLELKLARAATFSAGGVPQPRTAELVRRAADQLRDPARRLPWELRALRDGSELASANALLDSVCGRDTPTAEDVDTAGTAWDEALAATETADLIAGRAQELGVEGASTVAAALSEGVVRDLAACIAATPAFDLDPIESDVGTLARQRAIDQSVEPLELACERLVTSDDLVRAWPGFAAHYERVTTGRGTYAARCAFDAIYPTVSNLAADKFNAGAHQIAGTMFFWLRDRAREVGDDEAYEDQRRNGDLAVEAVREHYAVVLPQEPMPWWRIVVILAFALVLGLRWCSRATDKSTRDPHRFRPATPVINIKPDVPRSRPAASAQ